MDVVEGGDVGDDDMKLLNILTLLMLQVMSLKYHVLHFIVKDIEKQLEKDKKQDPPAKTPFIDRWIKWQLMGREEDGFPVYQENFLRQGIKEFPFPESQLFKMLVTNFSHCQVCMNLLQFINHQ